MGCVKTIPKNMLKIPFFLAISDFFRIFTSQKTIKD